MNRLSDLALPVEFGNAGQLDTGGTGWFIGFSDWAQTPGMLRLMPQDTRAHGLCVKWFDHEAGHPRGEPKPLSTGRTMSILVTPTSEFRIEFSADPDYPPEQTAAVVLRQSGDFAIWGPGVYHRAFGVLRATILSVRWELDGA